jgi:hypothetical protein
MLSGRTSGSSLLDGAGVRYAPDAVESFSTGEVLQCGIF